MGNNTYKNITERDINEGMELYKAFLLLHIFVWA